MFTPNKIPIRDSKSSSTPNRSDMTARLHLASMTASIIKGAAGHMQTLCVANSAYLSIKVVVTHDCYLETPQIESTLVSPKLSDINLAQ